MREMLPKLKQMDAIKAIEDLKARVIRIAVEQGGDFYSLREHLRRWTESARRVIAEHLKPEETGEVERANRNMFSASGIDVGPMVAYLEALLETLRTEPELVMRPDSARLDAAAAAATPVSAAPAATKPTKAVRSPRTGRVFLVHGRDELNLHRLERMLREDGLQPVILKYEPGKGRTLIEKFEEEADGCEYAFVLLTPDDLVEYEAEGGVRQYAQARPNAIFELGWFYGQIRRKNVCILFKRGTQLHSDLDGISRIEFDDNVENKAKEIERELMAAGVRLRH